MSRTVGVLSTHLSTRSHTRCTMLRLDLRDGTTIAVTDHDKDLSFNLGDGAATYSSSAGIVPSDVSLAVGMDADNCEARLPIGETVTLEAVLGGRLDRARARLFQVNWKTLSGSIPILAGNVSEIRVEGGACILQIRSDVDRLNQVIGRLITPYCDADFGDARCTIVPASIVGTVTAVTSAMQFTVSFAGSYANDYFNMGTVTALSGALVGTLPVEIFDWTSAGAITLFSPLVDLPAIGATFTIKRGCSKLRKSSDASIPTCLTYSNVINFRGFPEVPGTDQVLKVAVPDV